MRKLSTVLRRTNPSSGNRPQNVYTSNESPLLIIIDNIYYFPMDWRKLMLDFCRIQVPVFQNAHLSASFYAISRPEIDIVLRSGDVLQLELASFCSLLEDIAFCPILCSLLSYFVRAEQTHWTEEFLSQKGKSLDKEVGAALEYRTFNQILDYSAIFTRSRR